MEYQAWILAVAHASTLGFAFALHLAIMVILCVAVSASDFLALPLAVEWLTLVVAVIHVLVRESRQQSSPPSVAGSAIAFGILFLMSFANSTTLLVRILRPDETGSDALCTDFSRVVAPCNVASVVIVLSFFATFAAFIGILISFAGPLSRMYRDIRRQCCRPAKVEDNAIELGAMPPYPYPSATYGKEVWTRIAL